MIKTFLIKTLLNTTFLIKTLLNTTFLIGTFLVALLDGQTVPVAASTDAEDDLRVLGDGSFRVGAARCRQVLESLRHVHHRRVDEAEDLESQD